MRLPRFIGFGVLAGAVALGVGAGSAVRAGEAKDSGRARAVAPEAYVLFCEGVALETEGKYAEGIQKLDKALALDPRSPSILFEIGVCNYRLAKNSDAVAYLKRALEIEPENGFAHEVLAMTYQAMGRRDEALGEFEAAAKAPIRPRNREGLIGRIAWIYERQGDYKKAIEWYRYLAESGYRRRETYLAIGALQLKERLYDDAFGSFRQVVRLTPSEDATAEEISRPYAELSETDRKAAIARAEALAAKSPDAPSQEVLAMACRAAGRRDDMLRALERAAGASSRRAAAQRAYLADYCEEIGEYARAIEWRRKLLEEQKTPSVESLSRIAGLYVRNEQLPDAIAAYRKALAVDPGRKDLLRNIADCYAQLYQWDQAAATLEESLQGKTLGSGDAETVFQTGECYARAGKDKLAAERKQQAYDLLTRSIGKADSKLTDVQIHLLLADLYYDDQKPDKALGYLLVVQQLDPNDPRRLLLLADGYKRVQNWRQMDATLDQFLAKDSKSVTAVSALLELAYGEEVLGRQAEADAAREKARKILLDAYQKTDNEATKAAIEVQLGEIEVRRNRLKAAIERFLEAARLNPQRPMLQLFIAQTYEGLCDWLSVATRYKAYLAAIAPKIGDAEARHLYRLGIAQTRSGQLQTGRENKAKAVALLTSTLDSLEKEKRGTPAHKAEILRTLAGTYAAEKQYDKALPTLERAVALAPPAKRTEYQLGLASLYDDLKRHDESQKILLEAHQREPNNPMVLNHLGYFYAERGRNLDQAVELVKKALHYDPLNGAYLDSLGWAYYQQGKNQQAADLLKRAAVYEEDAVILDHLGDAYQRLGKTQEARDAWLQALRHDPDIEAVKEKLKKTEPQAPPPPGPPKPPTPGAPTKGSEAPPPKAPNP